MRRTKGTAQLCRGFLPAGGVPMSACGSPARATGPSIPTGELARRSSVASALSAMVAVGALWIFLAPAQPAHRFGQAVAYGGELLHGVVQHRIPLRGVDNSVADSFLPLGNRQPGRLGLRMPRLGSVPYGLGQPRRSAALPVLVALLVATTVAVHRIGRRAPPAAEPEPPRLGLRKRLV